MRRTAVAVGALAVLVTSAPHGIAEETLQLDGQRVTAVDYEGDIRGASGANGTVVLGEDTDDVCVAEGCHTARLRLTLPKGRPVGALSVFVVAGGAPAGLALRVYDAQGREVARQSGGGIGVDPDEGGAAQLAYSPKVRLKAGEYTVRVSVVAGAAHFRGELTWVGLAR